MIISLDLVEQYAKSYGIFIDGRALRAVGWDDEWHVARNWRTVVDAIKKLAPCPFCGARGMIDYSHGPDDMASGFSAKCSKCPANFDPEFERWTSEKAIKMWNRRTRRKKVKP